MSRSIPRGKIRVYICVYCGEGEGTLVKLAHGRYAHAQRTGCLGPKSNASQGSQGVEKESA